MLQNIARAITHKTLCAAGIHRWSSSPRVSAEEYGTVIDHACDHCERDRFRRDGRYSTRLDRTSHALGIGPNPRSNTRRRRP